MPRSLRKKLFTKVKCWIGGGVRKGLKSVKYYLNEPLNKITILVEIDKRHMQAALVISRLFICKFTYSHRQNWPKMPIFKSKMDLIPANLRSKMMECIFGK